MNTLCHLISVVIIEEDIVMVHSEELIGSSKCLML